MGSSKTVGCHPLDLQQQQEQFSSLMMTVRILLEKQLALVHLVQNALHVIVADPGAHKGGKRNFLIDDPADGGAMEEVADLEM